MPPDDEAVDLSVELQRYVEATSQRLEAIDHYELLEVARDADKKTVKRAYFRLAAVLHPDRFFGKNLGRYKPGLLRVFARISLAYDTLSSPQRRAEYDEELRASQPGNAPASPVPAPPPGPKVPVAQPPPRAPAAPPVPDKRQAAMDALRARFVEGKGKAKQHAETAARARAAGDLETAIAEYRAALRYTPEDAALKKAHDEVQRSKAERASESRRRQALLEERYGHWAEAAESWQRVVELCPDDPQARDRLANALARARSGVR
jgi:curved DNA-binding protein CbpA